MAASEKAQVEAMLLMLKGLIADLDAEQRDRIRSAADDLKVHIRGLGDEGQVVLGLVSLEMQLEEVQ